MFINHYLQFGNLFFAMNERITIWLVSILERKKKITNLFFEGNNGRLRTL